MGKTDRSPRMGNRVERDPGVSRKNLTEIISRFRMPKFSAKTAAIAASAVTVCAAVIIVSVIGGRHTPVKAADIYIGADATSEVVSYGGVGRYSDITEDTEAVATESITDTEAPVTDAPETEVETAETALDAETALGEESIRYTVTFTFHSRDSISCSAEEAATVSELAEKLGITLTEADVLNVSADTVISEDTVITTDKVTYAAETVREAIPYTTKYVDDSSMYKGNTKITQYGQNGETVTEYEVKYVNGVEESRTETASYVTKQPVEQIIKRGTAVYTPPKAPVVTDSGSQTQNQSQGGGTFVGGDGKTYKYSRYIDVKATIYYTGGKCATGVPADETVIAVDPSVIPLGSKVYITGDYADIGVRTAADTGGSIKGNIIDICVDPSSPLAGNFGFRTMRVYILE